MTLISTLCRPFVALINGSVGLLVRLAGINPKDIEENVTEEEIIMMVSEGHEQGVIEASEAEMISNIFKFDDKEVSDIMTHRAPYLCRGLQSFPQRSRRNRPGNATPVIRF